MPEELILYPHQETALERVRHEMRAGNKRVILYAPTGMGKTETSMKPILRASELGRKATFLADRITLVEQTSQRLTKYGILHGVAQGANTIGRMLPIQVMSAQTMEVRNYWDPTLELMVMDECHTQRRKILEAAKSDFDGYFLGLSASPITKGLGNFWDVVVNGATTNFLLREINPATGIPYLCPVTFYKATRWIDMEGAPVVKGEWKNSAVTDRSKAIIGDVVPEWVRRTNEHFGGPVPTLLFSRTVEQGEAFCKVFQRRRLRCSPVFVPEQQGGNS